MSRLRFICIRDIFYTKKLLQFQQKMLLLSTSRFLIKLESTASKSPSLNITFETQTMYFACKSDRHANLSELSTGRKYCGWPMRRYEDQLKKTTKRDNIN